ncbi:Coenzyme PQQ synthesis protein E [bioreactor metagenome]|uniref:Coenzyme PQQ synthesis protein E n=1 Tax=bioreactor metagenome TaxID=1076179 RepID=A0A644ZL48_9ZZZZ|nr:GTP 3',8-cyclase MoaA [Christensenella sp.]
MRTARLTIAPGGGARVDAESLSLSPEAGVAGDRRSAKDGLVSLLASEAEESARGMDGLCTGRFEANLVTHGLDYAALRVGTGLRVGDCELTVTRVGKRCYEACQRIKQDETCPLPSNCAFARVVRGGVIHTNDEIAWCGGEPRSRKRRTDRSRMNDRFGRTITYLRLSLTERCTLKCAYCRAGEGDCPKKSELGREEFLRIVRAFVQIGVNKVRLTGGEPMLRRDLLEIISGIRAIDGIREIVMTTNGQHLPGMSGRLKQAGLSRLNISLDSLKAERYAEITGGGSLERVLTGIEEAVAAGFAPVKINVVLLRGTNDDEIDDFIALTKDRPVQVRFIEYMPLGESDHAEARVTGDEILASHPTMIPTEPAYPGQPSRDYRLPGHAGRVGLINPMSHRFCADCNRVRVMSDGMLRPCLGSNEEFSLKDALEGGDDAALLDVIQTAIEQKPKTHCFDEGFAAEKNMSRIGG